MSNNEEMDAFKHLEDLQELYDEIEQLEILRDSGNGEMWEWVTVFKEEDKLFRIADNILEKYNNLKKTEDD